jgi:hypothetical protein
LGEDDPENVVQGVIFTIYECFYKKNITPAAFLTIFLKTGNQRPGVLAWIMRIKNREKYFAAARLAVRCAHEEAFPRGGRRVFFLSLDDRGSGAFDNLHRRVHE